MPGQYQETSTEHISESVSDEELQLNTSVTDVVASTQEVNPGQKLVTAKISRIRDNLRRRSSAVRTIPVR